MYSNMDYAIKLKEVDMIANACRRNKRFLEKDNIKLSEIGALYESFEPRWVSKYNALEETKPAEIRTMLPIKYTIKDIIASIEGDEIAEHVFKVYIGNKIAHVCENAIKTILADTVEELEPEDIKGIMDKLKEYYNESRTGNARTQKFAARSLEMTYGIDEQTIKAMEAKGLADISDFRRQAYWFKVMETESTIDALQREDEDTSYGLKVQDKCNKYGQPIRKRNGEIKKENILVIDLKYFGQVSFHILHPKILSRLSENLYNDKIPLYDTRTVMLTDETSKAAQKIFDEKGSLTLEELLAVQVNNPNFAHYLAVKQGNNRDEIQQLYDSER